MAAVRPSGSRTFLSFPILWLRFIVTAQDPTNRVADVHFDAITPRGERLFVAEAPASTSVGGRFVDQTVTRMQEMLREEAAQPGSSRKWQTEFYYYHPETGVVVVVVQGKRCLFDIAYHLKTAIQKVTARRQDSQRLDGPVAQRCQAQTERSPAFCLDSTALLSRYTPPDLKLRSCVLYALSGHPERRFCAFWSV